MLSILSLPAIICIVSGSVYIENTITKTVIAKLDKGIDKIEFNEEGVKYYLEVEYVNEELGVYLKLLECWDGYVNYFQFDVLQMMESDDMDIATTTVIFGAVETIGFKRQYGGRSRIFLGQKIGVKKNQEKLKNIFSRGERCFKTWNNSWNNI